MSAPDPANDTVRSSCPGIASTGYIRLRAEGDVGGTVLAADVVGQGDVVVVVAAASPTTVLGRNELADLFLGRTTRFPDGRPAVPVDQREGSPPRAVADTEQLRRLIASGPSYIGYLDRSAVDGSLKVVRIE